MNLFAQHNKLSFNIGVDTLDDDVLKAVHFYQDYLADFHRDTLPDFSKYWSEEDCHKYHIPDQMVYGIASDWPTYSMGESRTILFIKPRDGVINIKTHIGWTDSQKVITTLCITNHYIHFDSSGKPQFINPVSINAGKWLKKIVGNITYIFPKNHRFNQKAADSLNSSINMLRNEWGIQPINITYYFADTREEIDMMRGFDVSILMGNRDKPTGISDDRDNLVYCSGLGENYFHEVVHIYLNHLFPNSPLKEGLAAMYGGSMGHFFLWHLNDLNIYLKQHPDNDIEDISYINNNTNPQSTVQALLCYIVYNKEGVSGLRRLMGYDSMETILTKEFGIEKTEHNARLRALVFQKTVKN